LTVNARSLAAMERIGLTYVRTFPTSTIAPVEGVHEAEVEYEITQESGSRDVADTARTHVVTSARGKCSARR